MKNLEEILDILSLKRQGYSERGIARKLGIHRMTVKKYLENPDWMHNRTNSTRNSKLDPFIGNIEAWLKDDDLYTATWIYDHLISLGFDGSYEIVKRRVKSLKTEHSRLAYLRRWFMNNSLILERVEANLIRLRLPRISQILQPVIKTAEEKSKSHLAFLDELLDEEVAQKEQRRVETNLRISGLPFIKTIDEFDFAFQPKLDRQKVMSLFDLTFIQYNQNVIFLGPPGVGKTHLAVALAVKACQDGFSIYSTTMEDLIKKLKKDHESNRRGKGRSYYKSALVIVDEVGYTPITREECNLFFRFIANRYEKASTIITSNKAFSDWTEMFHDQIIVTAILDRLLHHSIVLNIRGKSFRLKEKIEKEVVDMNGPRD